MKLYENKNENTFDIIFLELILLYFLLISITLIFKNI